MVAINKYTAPTEETSTNTGTIMVRTGTPLNLNPAREEEIDLRQVDEQHVKSLQKEDPFMYYSIPGVRKASILLKDVDYSDITSLGHSSSSSGSRRSSRQSEETPQQEAVDPSERGEEDAIKVSRTSRVSFECHPSVLMEDFMTDLEQEFDEEELGRLDDIVTLITSLHRQ